jgi:hypothetical protein
VRYPLRATAPGAPRQREDRDQEPLPGLVFGLLPLSSYSSTKQAVLAAGKNQDTITDCDLPQLIMITEAQEKEFQAPLDNFIDEQQIVIDMASAEFFQASLERMITKNVWQWLSLLQAENRHSELR